MRLHLDNNSAVGGAGQTSAAAGSQGAGGGSRLGRDSGAAASDSVGLSGPSAALSRLATDRASRLQQLSAAVRAGSYNISSSLVSTALVSQSIS